MPNKKDDAPFSVFKRAKELKQRKKEMQRKMEEAGDYGKPRMNDLDQLNNEMEHYKDTDQIKSIFEK